jgi:hypothetical protein
MDFLATLLQTADRRSGEIQGRPRESDRRHGRVLECFGLGKGEVRLPAIPSLNTFIDNMADAEYRRYPTSSLQFSSVFFTKAMN